MSVTRNPKERPVNAFIATSSFVNNFYTYTLTSNATTRVVTGALGAVTSATNVNCPAGRILKENGRRLYSNADPGISTFMVGVIDSVTGYSGLIDPNASLFQRYTNERAADLADGLDYSVGSGSNHRGGSTYTWGNVVAGKQIYSNTTTVIPSTGTNTVDFNVGQVYTLSPTGAVTINATVPPSGSIVYIVVTSLAAQTITFGTGFKKSGTLAAGLVTNVATVTFVSDGTNLNEISRSPTLA